MFSCCAAKREDVKGEAFGEDAVQAVDDDIAKGPDLSTGKLNTSALGEEAAPVGAELAKAEAALRVDTEADATAPPAGATVNASVTSASEGAILEEIQGAPSTAGAVPADEQLVATVHVAAPAADAEVAPAQPREAGAVAAGGDGTAAAVVAGSAAVAAAAAASSAATTAGGKAASRATAPSASPLKAATAKAAAPKARAKTAAAEPRSAETKATAPTKPTPQPVPAFLKTVNPLGQQWGEYVAAAGEPKLENGKLVGAWAECVCAGILFERTHESWATMPGYENDGPVGQIITFLETCGHGKYAQKLENAEQVFGELGDTELKKKLPVAPVAKVAAPPAAKAKAKGKAKPKAKPLPSMGAFLKRAGPGGVTWGQYVGRYLPKVDKNGELEGRWMECIRAGVAFEIANPSWESMPEFADGPCGQILEFATKLGMGKFEDALNQAEERARADPDALQDLVDAMRGALGLVVPADVGAFMQLPSPDGQSWAQFCASAGPPEIDDAHRLRGHWLDCLMAAVQFEFDNPTWEHMPGYSDGPVGHVIRFLIDTGHENLQQEFERAEEEIRSQQVPPGAGFGMHPMDGTGMGAAGFAMPPGGPGILEAEIMGNGMQVVEVTLNNNEQMVAEPGALLHVEDELQLETHCPPGAEGAGTGMWSKIKGAAKRWVVGESVFMMVVTNICGGGLHAAPKRKVAFAAPVPGQMVEVNLAEYGGSIVVQRGAYVCGSPGIEMTIAFQGFVGGLFGGEGFVMCRLQGNGAAFFHCGGCIVRKELAPGASLRVDTGCLAAHTEGVNFNIVRAGGLKSMFFGGEGFFLAHLQAPPQGGVVWIQSCPTAKMAMRVFTG